MKQSTMKLMTFTALAVGILMTGTRAEAASLPGQSGIRPAVDALAMIETVQSFVYRGIPYCWYNAGWNGPGWYVCSYGPWVRGRWWGGRRGWNSWWFGGWGRRPAGWGIVGGGGRRGGGGTTIIINQMGGGGGAKMGGGGAPKMGGGGGGKKGGGGSKMSDIRAKEAIALVGRLDNGLALYRFQYIGNPQVYVGVMAHEVQELIPEAVVRGDDGYLRVNYGMVGTQMQTWQQWTAH